MLEKPDLIGKLIKLRPLDAGDAATMFAYFEKGDEDIDRLTGTHETFTLAQIQAHASRLLAADDRADYAIIPHDASTLVGEVVLNNIDWVNSVAGFRIAIFDRQYFNKGYGSEATALMVRYGFETLGLNRIELEVYSHNPRAAHVYEKIGFVREGVRRQALLWNDGYHDAIFMAMLRSDYQTS